MKSTYDPQKHGWNKDWETDNVPDEIIGDDGDREILCEHGVGHSYEVHTCDGCCWGDAKFAARMLEVFGPYEVDG